MKTSNLNLMFATLFLVGCPAGQPQQGTETSKKKTTTIVEETKAAEPAKAESKESKKSIAASSATATSSSTSVTSTTSVSTSTAQVHAQINSVSPTEALSGMAFSLAGSNFKEGSRVVIGSSDCHDVQVTATAINCRLPNQAPAIYPVKVVDSAGVEATNALSLTSADPSVTYRSPAFISANSSSYGFGNVTIGSTYDVNFTLTNTGDWDATNIAINTESPFSIQANNCATLIKDATCQITVRFQPTTSASFSSAIQISYSNGTSTATTSIALQATTAPVIASITPTAVKNSFITISGSNFTSAATVSVGGSNCSIHTHTRTSTTIQCFGPDFNSGSKTVVLTQGEFTVTGSTAISFFTPASLSFSADSHDYWRKEVGSTSSTTFTVTNNGQYPATDVMYVSFDTNYHSISSTTCGTEIAAGASCVIQLAYQPTAEGDHYIQGIVAYTDGGYRRNKYYTITAQAMVKRVDYLTNGSSRGVICAKSNLGQAWCWGSHGGYGVAAINDANNDGGITKVLSPTQVQTVSEVVGIFIMGYIPAFGTPNNEFLDLTCFLQRDGTLKCAGSDATNPSSYYGYPRTRDTEVALLPDNQTGSSQHFCYAKTTGEVKCLGSNFSGQFGNGTATGNFIKNYTAQTVIGVTNPKQLLVVGDITCAVLQDNTAKCFGRNSGMLFDSNINTNITTPADLGLTGIKKLISNGSYLCAHLEDNTVKCRGTGFLGDGLYHSLDGSNSYSGNGISGTTSVSWVTVSGLTGVSNLYGGSSFACAKNSSNALQCWGHGGGNPAWLMYTPRATPYTLPGLSDVYSMTSRATLICTTSTTGVVKCVGTGSSVGMLGDGSDGDSYTPVTLTFP